MADEGEDFGVAEDEDIALVSRRGASSGRVDFGGSEVLYESSRSRIVLVPFFVPRSDHTELSVKLITYRKQAPPQDWVVVEEKSLSLQDSAARRLLAALQKHLAVAGTNASGDYIVIRTQDGTASLANHDPATVASALTKVLGQADIVRHLGTTELGEELVRALRTSIHLSQMRAAVATLRVLLDGGEDQEQVYQKWCEQHTWAFGNAYVMRDEIRNISPGDKLDLLLPTVIAGFRDIVELKRPSPEVLNWDSQHRNFYFAADVSRAIGQVHRYLDVLQEEASKGLRDHPEIVAYFPRAIVVIGRSKGWDDPKLRALHGLNQRLVGITVMTYDQLLAQGERLVDMLGGGEPSTFDDIEESAPTVDEVPLDFGIDDDIPF